MHRPRWMQLTVPSSGTRYIRDTFQNSGAKVGDGYAVSTINTRLPEFAWAHFASPHWEETREIAMQADQVFLTIRDPIQIWGTNTPDLERVAPWLKPKDRRDDWQGRGQTALRGWQAQNEFHNEVQPHVHRVDKDSLSDLSRWAGIELVPGDRYSKNDYRLKLAIAAHDTVWIRKIVGDEHWEWFVTEATPQFQDFYEAYGYDLWWKNG